MRNFVLDQRPQFFLRSIRIDVCGLLGPTVSRGRPLSNLSRRQQNRRLLMNTLIVAAIRCCLMFLVPTAAYAINAQWDLDPISGDWNTAANWTPKGVPNGPADIATFDLSNTTDVSISANTEVNGITFTSAATNPYTITASPGLTLTIRGVGITNNSGLTQNLALSPAGRFVVTAPRPEATCQSSTQVNELFQQLHSSAFIEIDER